MHVLDKVHDQNQPNASGHGRSRSNPVSLPTASVKKGSSGRETGANRSKKPTGKYALDETPFELHLELDEEDHDGDSAGKNKPKSTTTSVNNLIRVRSAEEPELN